MPSDGQFYDRFGPNAEHLARLRKGTDPWNEWRLENPLVVPLLRYADLSGLSLTEVNLANAELRGADLRRADLSEATLFQAELHKADLSDAHLDWTDLRGAKLHKANLSRASLRHANLYRADLIQTTLDFTDLSNVFLHTTAFSQVDLSTCLGLDSIVHGGESSVDIHTLLSSGRRIDRKFLAGTGIPDPVIDQLLSVKVVNETTSSRSCFISYSQEDERFAHALYNALKSAGVRCWFAPEDMRGGKKIFEQLDQAIRGHDRLIVVLSTYSLQSQWVSSEILKAMARETAESRRVLFPIRLVPYEILQTWQLIDGHIGKDVGAEIREYFIPDFSGWSEPKVFDAAVARLVRDLTAADEIIG
jgi:TIR domain-containing protein/pentapeptide repeat protein